MLQFLLAGGGAERGSALYPGGPRVGAGFRLVLRTVERPSTLFSATCGKTVCCIGDAVVLDAFTRGICAVRDSGLAEEQAQLRSELRELHDAGNTGDQGLAEYLEDMAESHFNDNQFLNHVVRHYQQAEELRATVHASVEQEAKLDAQMARFQPEALYAQMLMGVVQRLPALSRMCRFSLDDAAALVVASARSLEASRVSTGRAATLDDFETLARRQVYLRLSTALSTPHAFALAFALAVGHLVHKGLASRPEVAALVAALQDQATSPTDPQAFVETSRQHGRLERILGHLPMFASMEVSFRRDGAAWREYFAGCCSLLDDTPLLCGEVAGELPGIDDLTAFQKLLVWASLAPSQLADRCRDLIVGTIGDLYATRPPPPILESLRPSERLDQAAPPGEPHHIGDTAPSRAKLVVIAAMSKDVVQSVLHAARQQLPEGERVTSFGPDDSSVDVDAAVNRCAAAGGWVLIQNLQLAPAAFQTQLSRTLRRLRSGRHQPHERFATIITTSADAAAQLPLDIAVLCDVYVVESWPSPDGVREDPAARHDQAAAPRAEASCRELATILGHFAHERMPCI